MCWSCVRTNRTMVEPGGFLLTVAVGETATLIWRKADGRSSPVAILGPGGKPSGNLASHPRAEPGARGSL
jgi:hypothetical protein